MVRLDEEMALWFGQEIAQAGDNATQQILFEDIAERVADGAALDDAVTAVSSNDAQAGDFGIEVVGSLVAMAILEGLKVFWSAYVKELEEKLGKSMAQATVDFVMAHFKAESQSDPAALQAKIQASISEAGKKLNIAKDDLDAVIAAVGPAMASAPKA